MGGTISNPNTQQQKTFQGILTDSTPTQPLDKQTLIKILKNHHIDTTTIENPQTRLEDIIPTLRKAKINLPENFYREISKKLTMSFIDFPKVKQLYAEEQRGKLITVLPYPIISKYKVIPIEVKGQIMDLAVDNPLDSKVLIAIKYLFAQYKLNLCVVSTRSIDWAIDNIYNEIHKKNAMLDLYNRTPNQSAYRVRSGTGSHDTACGVTACDDPLVISGKAADKITGACDIHIFKAQIFYRTAQDKSE